MIGCSKKNRENYPENAFEQKKNKPRLKFNLGSALIRLRTTGPWRIDRKVLLIFEITTIVCGANISQNWLPKQSVHNLDKSRFLVGGYTVLPHKTQHAGLKKMNSSLSFG